MGREGGRFVASQRSQAALQNAQRPAFGRLRKANLSCCLLAAVRQLKLMSVHLLNLSFSLWPSSSALTKGQLVGKYKLFISLSPLKV